MRKSIKPGAYRKLDADDDRGSADGKAIILDGFSPSEVHALVALYRAEESLPQDVAFAMVTAQSAKRRLSEVISELKQDAKNARRRREQTQS